MQHRNAPLTPGGRRRLVALVEDDGLTIVDDCSRLAYAEIHADERAPTVAAFTRRAFEWFEGRGIVVERLMTDNHLSYTKSLAPAELLDGRRSHSALGHRPPIERARDVLGFDS
jgi:hypothetical protein